MLDRDNPVAEPAQAWLARKIQSGKLLTLPTYYPQAGDIGRRPDKYARILLAGWQNPQEAVHPRAWFERETQYFRQWVESRPAPRPIHPASGSVAARDVVAPEGVSWTPPHSREYEERRPNPRIRRRHFSISLEPRPVLLAVPMVARRIYFALCLAWPFGLNWVLWPPVSLPMARLVLILGVFLFLGPVFWRVIRKLDPVLAQMHPDVLRKPSDRGSRLMHDRWLDGIDEGRL